MATVTLISQFHHAQGTVHRLTALIVLLAVAAAIAGSAHAAPAAGETYVYRIINGYNSEILGFLQHEITAAGAAQGQAVSVSPDTRALGLPHTEIYAANGQWLRHPLDNHGLATDYEFAAALPAVQPPTAGTSWSVRTGAVALPHSVRRSVRIDGDVLGNARIRVPAGEFDTVKIRRIIYPGDKGDFKSETRIVENDWYAPALGRRVCTYHGDWHIAELTEVRAAAR